MIETLTAQTEDVTSKKRGRKATTTNYFDVREEEAVRAFLIAESYEEKNKIYNEFLRAPLDKMISSVCAVKVSKIKHFRTYTLWFYRL